MIDLLVLGYIPGTTTQIDLYMVIAAICLLLMSYSLKRQEEQSIRSL